MGLPVNTLAINSTGYGPISSSGGGPFAKKFCGTEVGAFKMLKFAKNSHIFLSFLTCLILSQKAVSSEIKIDECLTAQVDIAALNSLNQLALSIFPYSLQEPATTEVRKLSPEDFLTKYKELRTNSKDYSKQYEKLMESVHLFFISGGIVIKSMEPKVKANDGYLNCGMYSHNPLVETVTSQIPNLSPVLVGAVAWKLIDSSKKHQDKVLGSTADSAYFLIFGYNSWGAKNRKEAAEFNRIIKCTTDQIDQSTVTKSDEECEQIKKTEQYSAYRIFLASSILNFVFVNDYIFHQPESELAFGMFGDFLTQAEKANERISQRTWLGGAAYAISQASFAHLGSHYRKVLNNEKLRELAKKRQTPEEKKPE